MKRKSYAIYQEVFLPRGLGAYIYSPEELEISWGRGWFGSELFVPEVLEDST
jgi:hypothetical protein